MVNPMTTTGDTIYSSSGSTPARLGIGSTGNVLTVAGGVPTWAAPAGGGAGNIVQIATGTCSGSSVSLTGLSSYTELYLMISGVTNATTGGRFYFTINSNTGSNYFQTIMTMPSSGTYNEYSFSDTQGWLAGTNAVNNTDTQNCVYVSFQNCKNAGFTNYEVQSAYIDSPSGRYQRELTGAIYKVSEAVSSIQFYRTGGNFTAGTYTLFGA
jgi:phospholipase/lecithinase/hemolysin